MCVVSLGKALNEIASTFEWLDRKHQLAAWLKDRKGHFTISW